MIMIMLFVSSYADWNDSQLLNGKVVCEIIGPTYSDFSDNKNCPCEVDNCVYIIVNKEINKLVNMKNHNLNKELIIYGEITLTYFYEFKILTLDNSKVTIPTEETKIEQLNIIGNGSIFFNYDELEVTINKINIIDYQNQLIISYYRSYRKTVFTINEIYSNYTIYVFDVINPRMTLNTNSSIELSCDNQSYIYNYESIETCKLFNLYNRTCTPFKKTYKSNGIMVATCPCHSGESNCTIERHVDYEIKDGVIEYIGALNYTIPNEIDYLTSNKLTILDVTNTKTLKLVYSPIEKFNVSDTWIEEPYSNVTMFGGSMIEIIPVNRRYNIIPQWPYPRFISLKGFEYDKENLITIGNNDETCKYAEYDNDTGRYKCLKCSGIMEEGYCKYPNLTNCLFIISGEVIRCSQCIEGYYLHDNECKPCGDNCRHCENANKCILCENGYHGDNCTETDSSIQDKLIYCNGNETTNVTNCIPCPTDCIKCNLDSCEVCLESELESGKCSKSETIMSSSRNGVIYKNDTSYFKCGLYGQCNKCSNETCIECLNGSLTLDGSCSVLNCTEHGKCDRCSKGSYFDGNECIECANCELCNNGKCNLCRAGYTLNGSECINQNVMTNCEEIGEVSCIKCRSGYYYNPVEMNCELCSDALEGCTECLNSSKCLTCDDSYYLNGSSCSKLTDEIKSKCKYTIPGKPNQCAVCIAGYYVDSYICHSCISNCLTCQNSRQCIKCDENFFLLDDLMECISYDELVNCEDKTIKGCSKCSKGYYVDGQYCSHCSNKTDNCINCASSTGICSDCERDYILNEDRQCIHYSLIPHCKLERDNKCSECSFWHTPNRNGLECISHVEWWMIFVIVMLILVVTLVMIGVFIYLIYKFIGWKRFKKEREKNTIFNMKYSNVTFIQLANGPVVTNKKMIEFITDSDNEEIPVDEETKELICIGNDSRNKIKLQFSSKQNSYKYQLRILPEVVTIEKGKACEFEVFIKPLCTCNIDENIVLIALDLKKGKEIQHQIGIKATTVITTRLDPIELVEENKLGEGSFGIVYKGMFRGNTVAIKKMKRIQQTQASIEEFDKEVKMLDKFRCDYIVHFYGAVFIPDKICMVTELAPFGSLNDLIKNHNPLDERVRIKILYDCSKGIEYLHNNGILHRDIKPDNFLVFNVENVDKTIINAKLTDFGSSRNINMLLTNMTFTKGIGSPKYMSPEILGKEHYKKPSDIYSFAITMYEVMLWGNAYPKDKFKHEWDIANFITSGKRLSLDFIQNEKIRILIANSWNQNQKERLLITDLVNALNF